MSEATTRVHGRHALGDRPDLAYDVDGLAVAVADAGRSIRSHYIRNRARDGSVIKRRAGQAKGL
jgi:hypothetical protein